MTRRVTQFLVLSMLALTACGGDEQGDGQASSPDGDSDRVRVVVTFSLLSELAERIGGERVEVVTLIPVGVDEHSYQPSPAVARDVARADLALVNGYNLEEGLLPIIVQNVGPGVPVVSASRGLAARQGGHMHEFVEGDLDRAAIDRAVAKIGELAEAANAGESSAVDAIDAIDVVVHHLPSKSRTEAVRSIDGFIHDVPRGVITAEQAIEGILQVTRSYEPAPGAEAALAQIASLLDDAAAEDLGAEATLDELDRVLGRVSLDARSEQVREVDVAVQDWREGALSAAEALERVRDSMAEPEAEQPADVGGLVDDVVFATADPHLWLDARNMAGYAETVRDALIVVDPGSADLYRANAAVVIEELETLHEELLDAFVQIPTERRRMIVFHDAFQYFADAYRFEVTASVAAASPNQERSAATIVSVIEAVREAGVATIYREPQYTSESLDLIARETGTRVGVLHSIPSGDAPTYVEMMRANAQALVEGLAGGPLGN